MLGESFSHQYPSTTSPVLIATRCPQTPHRTKKPPAGIPVRPPCHHLRTAPCTNEKKIPQEQNIPEVQEALNRAGSSPGT